jgi:MoaA/NifB/PqqE/SkfB family radical SAM enzyme
MQDIKALIDLGRKYKEYKKFDRALNVLKEALVLVRGEDMLKSEAYNELAHVYMLNDKYDSAIKSFQVALSLNDKNLYAYLLLHQILRKKGFYKEALEELLKAFNKAKDGTSVKDEASREIVFLSRECARSGILPRKIYEVLSPLLLNPAIADNIKNDVCLEFIQVLQKENAAGKFTSVIKETEKVLGAIPGSNKMAYNAVLNETEIAERKTVLNSRARSLTVVLTQKCNLNCIMCTQDHKEKDDISAKVIDEIKNALPYIEQISWCGGEVLLYDKFDYIFNEACKYPVKQEIITNGTLLTRDIAQKYFNNNVTLNISIDGITKDVYEKIRRGASFDALLKNLEMLRKIDKKRDYNYHMLAVVMKSNYDQMHKFAGFAKKYGFTGLIMNFVIYSVDNDEDIWFKNRNMAVMKQVMKANKELSDRCKEYKINFSSNITEDFIEMGTKNNTLGAGQLVSAIKKNELTGICFSPWKRLTISMNGDVFPYAHSLCSNVVGNLNNCTLEELWNGKKMTEYRKSIIAHKHMDFCTPLRSCGKLNF